MDSRHHPNGGAAFHCDNDQIEREITRYQETHDITNLAAVVSLTQDRAVTLIKFFGTTRFKPQTELLSDINLRMIKAIERFDASKGSAFSFVSTVITNTLRSSVTGARKDSQRYCELTSGVLQRLTVEPENRTVIDDIRHKIKVGARTTLTDKVELSVQRWYIESFLDEGFQSRRHECANAATVLFSSLGGARARAARFVHARDPTHPLS